MVSSANRRPQTADRTPGRTKVSAEGRGEVSISARSPANRACTPWCADRSTFEGDDRFAREVLGT